MKKFVKNRNFRSMILNLTEICLLFLNSTKIRLYFFYGCDRLPPPIEILQNLIWQKTDV